MASSTKATDSKAFQINSTIHKHNTTPLLHLLPTVQAGVHNDHEVFNDAIRTSILQLMPAMNPLSRDVVSTHLFQRSIETSLMI